MPTERAESRWAIAIESLDRMARLEDDWDGMGSEVPAPEIVARAIELIGEIRGNGWPAPSRVTPCPAGSIILEWQTPDKYLDIDIESPGELEWMSSVGDGQYTHGDGLPDIPAFFGGEEPI